MPCRCSSNCAPALAPAPVHPQGVVAEWGGWVGGWVAQPVAQTSTHARVRTLHSADVFFGQNIVPVVDAVGRKVSVGDEVMATPRRPRGLLSRGLRGVDY